MSKGYRKYSPEFREEVVKLVIDTSRAITDVAREYGGARHDARQLGPGVQEKERGSSRGAAHPSRPRPAPRAGAEEPRA